MHVFYIKQFLVAMVALLYSATVSAYDFSVDGICYNINGNEASVTSEWDSLDNKLVVYEGSVIIPSTVTYDGVTYNVTSIGKSAFSGCWELTNITIPNSVTSIESSAFRWCSGLTSITIPNSVTSIGGSAFSGCTALTSINVEKGNSIYDSRNNCNAIIETKTNTLIFGCKNTIIPEDVTSIGDYAFSGSGLTSITIPNSVISIGERVFDGCRGLTNINVEKGNSTYDSRNNCNAIIETKTNTLIFGCKNTIIPEDVTSIGDYAFSGSDLTSITIPNSVTSIGTGAFNGTAWYYNQSDGVVYAGKVLYGYKGEMPSGTSINVKEGTLGIADSAFYCCYELTSITIPNSVTNIGDYAFEGCI